ncbi:MAG: restriction endonuclease subunit S [Bacteroidales bacterium]
MKEDWIEIELGEILNVSSGSGLTSKEMSGSGFPVYGGNGITGYHSEYLFEDEKLIIGRVGVRCGITHITKPKSWVTDNALVVTFKEKCFDLNFMKLKLHFENLNKLSNSTAQPVISGAKIYSYSIDLPPLPIQRAIVTKIENLFTSLDKGIADLKRAQEQLKIYRQAVLKKAFEGKYVNDSSNWKQVKISSLCEVVRGGSPRPAGDPRYYEGNIPFLKVADLTRNEGTHLKTYTYSIKEAGLKKTRLVNANTLLLSNSGATLGIPKICSFETTFNDGIAAFLGLEDKSLLYHYYFWLSKTKELRNINQGAAQPNLNTNMIGAMEIPIGSSEDQNNTVKEIESRLSVCDKVEQSITETLEKSEALRQSILKKAFEGKLLSEAEIEKCKQEADYEPASMLLEKIKTIKNG